MPVVAFFVGICRLLLLSWFLFWWCSGSWPALWDLSYRAFAAEIPRKHGCD